MTAKQIQQLIESSRKSKFGIRALHEDELPEAGEIMPDSCVWEDGDRTEESIGGTCCFDIRDGSDLELIEKALRLAQEYSSSTKCLALLGGQYYGNNDLIAEPHTVAIRDAEVLAVWEASR